MKQVLLELTILGCEGYIMVEELPKLHHHVGVPRVRKVLIWAGSHIYDFLSFIISIKNYLIN